MIKKVFTLIILIDLWLNLIFSQITNDRSLSNSPFNDTVILLSFLARV